jgi:hypothetical protein
MDSITYTQVCSGGGGGGLCGHSKWQRPTGGKMNVLNKNIDYVHVNIKLLN